jgi:hypothetical protein
MTKRITHHLKLPCGRPSKFREEFVEQAYKLCLLGASDAQMADFFGINEDTLNQWKHRYPAFRESFRRGKDLADAEIALSLYHRAKGYEHPDVHVSSYEGEVTLTPLVKRYPPDTQAASLWLRNRQSRKWRDRIEHTGADGGPISLEAILLKVAERERAQLEPPTIEAETGSEEPSSPASSSFK